MNMRQTHAQALAARINQAREVARWDETCLDKCECCSTWQSMVDEIDAILRRIQETP